MTTIPAPRTGGEALVRALAAHGVDLVFGIPGTHNLELYRHFPAHGIRHVAPRHEQGAGYAADGYARTTGRPGIAVTTTGPALLNITAAVGQAYSDSVPLLVVSPGMPLRHPVLPTGLLHETRSQTAALSAVAAVSHRVSSVAEVGEAVARAFTLFRHERPRPVHLEIPLDLMESPEPTGPPPLAPPAAPRQAAPTALRKAAAALSAARTPALVLGGGARRAAAECLTLAEKLGAPVLTTANGKGIVPEDHPLSAGVSLHSPSVRRRLCARDTVLAIGTELAESDLWTTELPLTGTLIRIDLDPAQTYATIPAAHPLVGDARTVLRALLPLLDGPPSPDGPRDVRDLLEERNAETAARDARWLPYLRTLRSILAPDAVITSDQAQCCYYGALPHLPLGPAGRLLHPTGFATLGYALPAAVGAKCADPGRQVIALCGDGGLQFTVQELATAAALGHPLPVVVFDNGGYAEIRDGMRARGDTPYAVDLPPVDLPALARAYGGHGVRADTPAALGDALRTALTVPGPTLIHVPEEGAP
ncbi:putative 2-ketoarginine decarboxylase AruI [Streptomyces sp. RB5]|uniref:Putative 2-ketoarginine decarboxylase AruI n=1 Tax=Streptomyces smaragdinus TaxID=2585196 RepID=A0A7K0CAM8_9ACTN|nr:5-guanidino-2-oxopentanoate decarboxylase [Streptomyces smaragdinus]MQY10507.1 putative 2-ketoarginine decarboxylase AruI [Streptomyces smaragdinus]